VAMGVPNIKPLIIEDGILQSDHPRLTKRQSSRRYFRMVADKQS